MPFSVPGSHPRFHLTCRLLWAVEVSETSFVFVNCSVLRNTGQVYGRMPLYWDSSGIFLTPSLALVYTLPWLLIGDVDLLTWLRWGLLDSSTEKGLFPPFCPLPIIPVFSPLSRRGNYALLFVGLVYLYKLFGILLNEKFAFYPLFTYLFIHSFIYIMMNSWVFYTLGYKPILLYFVTQIVPDLVKGAPPSLWHTPTFLSTFLFLALQDAPDSVVFSLPQP